VIFVVFSKDLLDYLVDCGRLILSSRSNWCRKDIWKTALLELNDEILEFSSAYLIVTIIIIFLEESLELLV